LSAYGISHFIRKLNKIIIFGVLPSEDDPGWPGRCVGIYSMFSEKYYFCNQFYEENKDEEWFKNIMSS
jgi:hypothetical protein